MSERVRHPIFKESTKEEIINDIHLHIHLLSLLLEQYGLHIDDTYVTFMIQ